jgi:hypothetical protein
MEYSGYGEIPVCQEGLKMDRQSYPMYDLDESLRISTLTRGRDTPTLNMSLPSE